MNKHRFLLLLAGAVVALALPAYSSAADLEGPTWTLTELSGKPFAAPANGRGAPTLLCDAGKKGASGFASVNRFFGSYTKDGDKLKFGPLASTKMGGSPEAMQAERAYLKALESVTHWQIADGGLALLNEGQVVARFAQAAEPAK